MFAWKTTNMTGVPRHITEHRLNVQEGCPPVRQKKRGQTSDTNQAMQEEDEKLIDAGIMKEFHYHSWLSNSVMVKKHDGSRRMYVDFKDLNKACPNDGYPLSEIDWKVESLCRFPFKCFLDAYKGYHQIKMAKKDEEKTTFITSQGIFCYAKMPFGLRNARATYQRLVDKAFHKKIGRNLEDVQKLNGKLASLNRFLAKSAEKSLPFFETLNKCTKKSNFHWTEEVESAFKQMKQLIAKLPALTAPKEKEELIVYLAAVKEAVSESSSQLEIHGAGVSTEYANQKFLRSLPASWSQVSLIMRTKPGVDTLSFDDLYNNLRVFESDIKGSTASSSSTQNVAFVSSESTNSTNDVDEFDLEEMDLKWQVAMISMRLKKFYKKTGRRLQFDAKEPVGFDKTKVECFNCHNTGHFARECRSKGNQESRRRDAGNTRYKAKDNLKVSREKLALMAYNSNSGFDTEVEAQLVAHQKNQLWYEEKIRFMKIDLDDKTDVLTYHKKLLAEAVQIKMRIKKTKLEEYFNVLLKGLSKLLNSQMSTRDKSGSLGLCEIKYMKEIVTVYDRFAKVKEWMSFPQMKGNYMPPKSNFGIDESNFTYGPKQSKTSEYDAKTSDFALGDPQKALKNKGIIDSGCSRHMTRNKAYLVEYQDYNGGPVSFGGSKGYISDKGKIKTKKLDFEDVCFVKEVQHFNLFSVSQMCDKKNKVLFTDTECLVLSPDFKLPDENQVLLRVPRQTNMYSFNLENIVPTGGLACLISKAIVDESNK
ncbi:ribonuclease H-like domain-containing protein [Tanacetum coccineum]